MNEVPPGMNRDGSGISDAAAESCKDRRKKMDEFTKVKIVIVVLIAIMATSLVFYSLGVSRATEIEQEKCRQELAAPHKLEVVITDKTCSCTEIKTETGNE